MANTMAMAATGLVTAASSTTLSSLRESSFTENAVSRKCAPRLTSSQSRAMTPTTSSITASQRPGSGSGPGTGSGPSVQTRSSSDRVQQSGDGVNGVNNKTTRRELILQSSSMAVLAAIFHFSGTRPAFLGVREDPPSLNLCPATPNCISTAEEANNLDHYVPPWTYNPEDGRGRTNPATKEQAYEELLGVIESTKPDGFTPTVIKKTDDYIYVEYESPNFGFVDDVEFWFPPGNRSFVEYRSASRLGESDLDANRKRIKFLRQELQKKGWASVGY